ncbi:hypothetical protein B711_0089 [Chlamydia psittaci CP3]|nr:hypothetical protein B711_0089 [Chlamydia psittaci CP3]EPJ14006.1 hypothetical protein CP02DC16_0491 [Chlamydia psittaci 02DC16]EPJ18177.1 hypothetical protein CP01DC11_0851 [Chlamydia psittaci 01DC11]EPJ19756.1 hypothetical protein CP02DC23_0841 [Chlamydia psittaci 02DC23]EPJ27850.1 hypothetical protein CPC1998_0847 [Chlamydia psittaci C19/98]EPJ98444.1 hypothetical protein CP02DC24_0839 [Chlamydia psittaci 02DC24]
MALCAQGTLSHKKTPQKRDATKVPKYKTNFFIKNLFIYFTK